MSDDFLRDLEGQLRAAAARRRSPRRSRLTRLAPALAAAALIAVVVVVALRAGEPDTELPAQQGAAPTVATFALPGAVGPIGCDGSEPETARAPEDVVGALGVLRGEQGSTDRLSLSVLQPVVEAVGAEMRAVRRTGDVFVVPAANAPAQACPGTGPELGPGACIVHVKGAMGRCFSLADIQAGRAAMLLPGGAVVGLAPDGIAYVEIQSGPDQVGLPVTENVWVAELPSAKPGDMATVTLKATDRTCEPPPARTTSDAPPAGLLDAVPALRKPRTTVPIDVAATLRDLDAEVATGSARVAIAGGDVRVAVVAVRDARGGSVRCLEAGPSPRPFTGWGACAIAYDDAGDDLVALVAACGDERSLASGVVDLRDHAAVGFAPAAAGRAVFFGPDGVREGRGELPVQDGVIGGDVDASVHRTGWSVRFDDASGTPLVSTEADIPKVAVLNATTITGLGASVMRRLERVNYVRGTIGNAPAQNATESTIYYAAGKSWLGGRIGEYLKVSRREEMPPDVAVLVGDADAVVLAGTDLVE